MTHSLVRLLMVLLCCYTTLLNAGRTDLDEILAVLPHPDGDILILASDLQMTFDGTTRTFRDVALDGLMELKARDLGIKVASSVVESMMASIQKKYSLSQSQLVELFEAQGLTMEEARLTLKRRRMIDDLLGSMMRVDEPSTQDIERYYEQHPDVVEAAYEVRLAFVPEADMSLQELETMIQENKIHPAIVWDTAETYRTSDLAESQKFITTMKVGEVRIMAFVEGGYDLVQLVSMDAEQVAPLDVEKVGRVLRQELFLKALNDFQAGLLAKAKIRFCRSGLSLDAVAEEHPASKETKEIID